MLVLSRKSDEAVCIGDSIRVKVIGIQGQKVRLGIEAPPHVRIQRDELLLDCDFEFLDLPQHADELPQPVCLG